MKNRGYILTFTVILFCLHNSHSQSIESDLLWAKNFNDIGLSSLVVEVDLCDNILMAGLYTGCANCFIEWQGDTLVNGGTDSDEIFVIKIDNEGQMIWNMLIGGSSNAYLSGIKVDNNNNVILFMRSHGAFQLAAKTLDKGQNIIKLDSDGLLLWSLNIQGSYHNILFNGALSSVNEQISIQSDNDIVIGGSIGTHSNTNIIVDTTAFEGDSLPQYLQVFDTLRILNDSYTVDTNNIFVATISSTGNLKWLRTFEHNGAVSLASLVASENQSTTILGNFENENWTIDNTTLEVDLSANKSSRNMYMLKLDKWGNLIWANRYFNHAHAENIAMDGEGNIIATGYFYISTYFMNDTVNDQGMTFDVLLFKVNSLGNYIWGTNVGNPYSNLRSHLGVNSDNDIYITGELSPCIMNKYSSTGELLWELNPPRTSNRRGGDIEFDYSGNLIQCGIYTDDFVIGNMTLESKSHTWSKFILKYGNQTQPDDEILCIEEPDSIITNDEFIKLKISPNPTLGTITIEVDLEESGPLEVFIYSMESKLINKVRFIDVENQEMDLNLSHVSNGTYVLKVISNTSSATELFVKY